MEFSFHLILNNLKSVLNFSDKTVISIVEVLKTTSEIYIPEALNLGRLIVPSNRHRVYIKPASIL